MKRILLASVVLLGLAACDDPQTTVRVLSNQGFTDIWVDGWSMFGCSRDDQWATKFRATAPNGKAVSGVVCSGIFKGATVRFY